MSTTATNNTNRDSKPRNSGDNDAKTTTKKGSKQGSTNTRIKNNQKRLRDSDTASRFITDNIKLTRKQKAFADHLLNNPKDSATKAVQATYDTDSYTTQRHIASDNLTKANIRAYLDIHSQQAENTVLEVMDYSNRYGKQGGKEGASYATVALNSAKDILDRVHGKARQQIDVQSTSVNINIDLSSE